MIQTAIAAARVRVAPAAAATCAPSFPSIMMTSPPPSSPSSPVVPSLVLHRVVLQRDWYCVYGGLSLEAGSTVREMHVLYVRVKEGKKLVYGIKQGPR